jgi:hypothetical protein
MTKSERIKSIVLVSSPKAKAPKYLTVNQSLDNMLAWGWSKENLSKNIVVVGVDHNSEDARKHILKNFKAFL